MGASGACEVITRHVHGWGGADERERRTETLRLSERRVCVRLRERERRDMHTDMEGIQRRYEHSGL